MGLANGVINSGVVFKSGGINTGISLILLLLNYERIFLIFQWPQETVHGDISVSGNVQSGAQVSLNRLQAAFKIHLDVI